jgi:acyl-CoA synthetase (AMP-forming)/AMP-acid ligase II
MKGYLHNPKATSETLTGDGFLRTGDVAVVDEYEQFRIVDRIKELIKSKGHQVAPAELEALLLEHPHVADCAVTGYHDKENATELPRAFIVLAPGGDPLKIKEWFDNKVARHKRLWGGIVVLDIIPKSPSGKILRRQLRDRRDDVAVGYPQVQARL